MPKRIMLVLGDTTEARKLRDEFKRFTRKRGVILKCAAMDALREYMEKRE